MDWRAEVRDEFSRLGRPGDDDVIEELAQHASASWTAERAEGASPDEADAAVRELIRAWCRGTAGTVRARRAPLVESAPASSSRWSGVGLDLRHALRLLRRQPGFSIVSVLMIALGIAATSTIFSVVSAVLLRPLPWANVDRIVRLAESREGGTANTTSAFTNAAYLLWKDNATTIDAIGAWTTTTAAIEGSDGADRVPVATVTTSLLPLLGVSPLMGQGFSSADESAPVVILSYAYWRDRFGRDPQVVGKTVRFVSGARTVVGVMPASFEFLERDTQLWIPMTVAPAVPATETNGGSVSFFSAVARMKPGVTAEQAGEEGQRLARTGPELGPVIPAVFGAGGPPIVHATPIVDAVVGDVRWALWLLLAAVLLLWFAATANVASMQLAHAAGRQREVAIRAAIGAGRGRLIRQMLVETTMLSAVGGVVGLAATAALLHALPGLLPEDFPRPGLIALDWRVGVAAFALVVSVAVVVGLLPARLAARLDVRSALVDDGSTPASSRLSPARARLMIITLQVAIATLLLVGASLLGRSFVAQWSIDRGFVSANVLTARVRLPGSIATPAARQAAFHDVQQRLSQRSGVRSVGLSDDIPLGGSERRFASMTREPGKPDRTVSALLRFVSASYLPSIGMRVSAGRSFNDADSADSEPVAVVNRTFAARYLGDQPVGAVLPAQMDNAHAERKWRVIGIVDDAMRAGLTAVVQPEIFLLDRQVIDRTVASAFITVKTSGDPAALATDLRSIVRSVDRLATIDQVMTMDARILKSLSRPRLYATLFAGFGGFALLIAVVGLFGGISYGVTQRTREISVRAALGATPGDIVRLIVFQGFTLALAGVCAGVVGAALGARFVSQFLYGITTRDLPSYAGAAAALLALAAIACAIPARRAARIDPLKGMKG